MLSKVFTASIMLLRRAPFDSIVYLSANSSPSSPPLPLFVEFSHLSLFILYSFLQSSHRFLGEPFRFLAFWFRPFAIPRFLSPPLFSSIPLPLPPSPFLYQISISSFCLPFLRPSFLFSRASVDFLSISSLVVTAPWIQTEKSQMELW